jgi:hypothetical protein
MDKELIKWQGDYQIIDRPSYRGNQQWDVESYPDVRPNDTIKSTNPNIQGTFYVVQIDSHGIVGYNL